ncbi:phosphatidate cytidylyltransferase [Candidatus Purcelliella pentastirinorum]|uniref:Phosphatidate cytidylyltransferase n=1 Tax=Candidatus Purcelliella pentastirinorum TaxID=472834 RepID=A0AAX3N8H2_9ENTR|nr:phosphatidate cytidylyltransferase [Candidatus Purcelliella pentastirinorum]WDI78683.1 phosphatidate cytidylyltransferase [Candidatus Purcelliella pentastirinorum]
MFRFETKILLNRIIVTLILVSLIYFILFFLTLYKFIFSIFLLFVLSIYEWVKINKIKFFYKFIFIFCFIIFIFFYNFFLLSSLVFINNFNKIINLLSLTWCLLSFFLIIYYPKSSLFWKNSYFLKILFGFLILVPFFYDIIFIRQLCYEKNHYYGSYLLLYILIPIWVFDSSSYIFGMLFGINKLFIKLSPGKTFEGYISGVFFLTLIFFIYKSVGILNISNLYVIIISFLVSVLSLFGDLQESMFKRIGKVKNSGRLFFSHGGILDRIDSLTIILSLISNYLLFLQVHKC